MVATARNRTDIADLLQEGKIELAELDVTDVAQREAVVADILARLGRIDGLVNNAGYGVNLPIEETDMATLRAIFETNVFSLHAMTLLVVPGMRTQGSGRIVNVASIAGHVSVPMMGAYCATKFAVRAMTQALHNEMRGFGVRVALIEPGIIRTEFGNRARRETAAFQDDLDDGPYAVFHRAWNVQRTVSRGSSPQVIAKAIVHACLDQHPRFHYLAPLHAKSLNIVNRLTPDAVLNAGFRAWFRVRGRRGKRVRQ